MIITFEAILLDYISSTFVFEIILSQSAFAILYRSFFSWRDFRFEISFLKHFILHFQHSDVKVVIFLELSPNIAPTFFLKLPSLENYILLKSKLVKQAILGQKQICNNQPDCLNTQYLRTTVKWSEFGKHLVMDRVHGTLNFVQYQESGKKKIVHRQSTYRFFCSNFKTHQIMKKKVLTHYKV